MTVNSGGDATSCTPSSRADDRPIKGARDFIATKGWMLDDTQIGTKQVKGPDGTPIDRPVFRHIYEDDGVSGALFASRAEFQRMLRDAEAGAFDALAHPPTRESI